MDINQRLTYTFLKITEWLQCERELAYIRLIMVRIHLRTSDTIIVTCFSCVMYVFYNTRKYIVYNKGKSSRFDAVEWKLSLIFLRCSIMQYHCKYHKMGLAVLIIYIQFNGENFDYLMQREWIKNRLWEFYKLYKNYIGININ